MNIQKLISKIISSNSFLPFGLQLLHYPIKLVKSDKNFLAFHDLIDNKIVINLLNPFFKDEIDNNIYDKKIIFVLLHEMAHKIFDHDKRLKSKDKIIWNYACDYMINLFLEMIDNDLGLDGVKNLNLKISNYSHKILYDIKFKNKTENEIYQYLLKNGNYSKQTTKIKYDDFKQSIGLNNNTNNDDEIEITKVKFKYNNKTIDKTDIKFPKKYEDDNITKTDNTAVKQILYNNLIKGSSSESISSFLQKLFKVKVNWNNILKSAIYTHLCKSELSSFSKPTLSYYTDDDFPYLPTYIEDDSRNTIVILCDESGSMSDNDIRKCIDILVQSKKYFKTIYCIKHDTKISKEIKTNVENLDQIFDTLLTRYSCGGTSHEKCFKRILEINTNNKISLVLAFTDLMSDIEKNQNIITGIPIIYLTPTNYRNFKHINGKIIKID